MLIYNLIILILFIIFSIIYALHQPIGKKLKNFLVCCSIGIIIFILTTGYMGVYSKIYNNGYCIKCNTKYQFTNSTAAGKATKDIYYTYHCPKCETTVSIPELVILFSK